MSLCKSARQQGIIKFLNERVLRENKNAQDIIKKKKTSKTCGQNEKNYQASQAMENCSKHHNLVGRYATAMHICNYISSGS